MQRIDHNDVNASSRPIDSGNSNKKNRPQLTRRPSLSKQLSETVKPETPLGWIALLTTLSSAILMHEIRLQKKLTCPPLVYTNLNNSQHSISTSANGKNIPFMKYIIDRLSHNPKAPDGKGILTRTIKPSLLVGTRGFISSTAAYLMHGPKQEHEHSLSKSLQFREIMTTGDGATLALDWEVPRPTYSSSLNIRLSDSQIKANVLYGPITEKTPVVIILHGINNDTGFGYMKNLMRACSKKGWIACGMNFRGCGGQKLTTPRGYTAAYTGDLRHLIHTISARLKGDTPVFLCGNSLGANLVTKYLGEEGFSGTLPSCIKGGVSLGNPLHIHGGSVKFPFNMLLGAGVKKTVLQSWNAFNKMSSCFHYGKAFRKILLSRTIGELDDAASPFLIRNDNMYPFNARVGYKDGEDYWHDASSNRVIQHVTVPLLNLSAQDDFLVKDHALQSLSRCLVNPNILVVKTKCGGHLGWQEAPPQESFGIGKSWADTAMVDFIEAILDTRKRMRMNDENEHDGQTQEQTMGISTKTDTNTRRGDLQAPLPRRSRNMDLIRSTYASRNIKSKL